MKAIKFILGFQITLGIFGMIISAEENLTLFVASALWTAISAVLDLSCD